MLAVCCGWSVRAYRVSHSTISTTSVNNASVDYNRRDCDEQQWHALITSAGRVLLELRRVKCLYSTPPAGWRPWQGAVLCQLTVISFIAESLTEKFSHVLYQLPASHRQVLLQWWHVIPILKFHVCVVLCLFLYIFLSVLCFLFLSVCLFDLCAVWVLNVKWCHWLSGC